MSSGKTTVVDDAGPVSREAWESAGTDFNAGAKVHRKPSLEDRVEKCELVIRALTDGLTELASDLEKRVERLENPETQPDPEERAS